VLWHVNNEYGGNWPNYCYCERCAGAFRSFLERRHGSLAGLNAAWSTAFWGHTYSSWSQIEPPLSHGERSIPAMQIDWRRFQSQSYLDCFEHEAAVLRRITPNVPITTNFMGAFFALDYQAWAPSLDVAAWDNYPQPDTHFTRVAFGHALTRGLRDGEPFLLCEQSPSHQNWSPYCRLKPPGQLRLLSLQAVAHGAESVMYFQWRKSRGGIEKLHGAVVEHHGRSDARVFREVSALGAELESLGGRTLGGRTPSRVAVLFDWESWWGLSASSGPSRDFDYHAEVVAHYAVLHARGIQTDVIGPHADLSRYELIVLPLAYMLRSEQVSALEARVSSGATLVASFFAGMIDENDRIHAGGAPGPLSRVLGVRVEEYDALPRDVAQSVRFAKALGSIGAGASEPATLICERLWLEGAEALATYGREFYAGEPAITVNAYGAGKAYYVGTRLAEGSLSALLGAICAERGITSPLGAAPPAGVEVTARVSPRGETLLYLLNHATERREVRLPSGQFVDLLDASPSRAAAIRRVLESSVTLEPRGVCVLAPA
jgi:beta-galactosidase